MSNKVDFWPNPHETSGCYGNAKNDGHILDKLKFPQRMTEHLLKVSALIVNRLQNLEKTL